MTSFTLTSQYDALTLHALLIEPSGEPKAVFQLVHGMCEHKERYIPFMEFMASNGYLCVIHDHRGHGESVKSPSDYGYMYSGGAKALVEDVKLVNDYIVQHYPGKKIFLLGHSMGSMVVRNYVRKYDDNLSGLIVCGSPSYRFGCPFAIVLVNVMGLFLGMRYKSEFVKKLTFGHYLDHIPDAKSQHSWLCTDDSVVEAYDADPLCGFTFSLCGNRSSFLLMWRTYNRFSWNAHFGRKVNADMPIYFIGGTEDPCIDGAENFADAVQTMRNVGYKTVDSRLFPGMRHEILNEKEKQTVWQSVLDWLEKNR